MTLPSLSKSFSKVSGFPLQTLLPSNLEFLGLFVRKHLKLASDPLVSCSGKGLGHLPSASGQEIQLCWK